MFQAILTDGTTITANILSDIPDMDRQHLVESFLRNSGAHFTLMNSEVEYILRASVEDSENTPFCYDDITNNEPKAQVEISGQWEELTESEVKEKLEFWEYLRDKCQLLQESLERCGRFGDGRRIEKRYERYDADCYALAYAEFDNYPEIYQWFLVDSWTIAQLESRGQCTLDGSYWGRQTYGQSIVLDCVIQDIAFEWFSGRVSPITLGA